MICNQNKIPKSKWRYGFRSSAATGCGWIATYNALKLMGYHEKPEKIIAVYQRGLPLINGNLGTFLLTPICFFIRRGFRVKLTFGRKRMDEGIKNCDVGILFYYWFGKFKIGAHYATVCRKEDGIIGYNTFRNSHGMDVYGTSLSEFLRKQHYLFPVLIGIKDPGKRK